MADTLLLTPPPLRRRAGIDERPARAAMRAQIERLERRLAGFVCTEFPTGVPDEPLARGDSGARLQTLAELERRRDALSARIAAIQAELDTRGARQELARRRLEAIVLEPWAHPWERVTNADIGDPGCRQYHARPRFGILGLFLDWWRVRISSGCPLCMPL
jgi:hypothetical protein